MKDGRTDVASTLVSEGPADTPLPLLFCQRARLASPPSPSLPYSADDAVATKPPSSSCAIGVRASFYVSFISSPSHSYLGL
ncbi:hypothetical protein CHARACLAT_011772 [Characodon lateralis]|uniref:Uncharacterized protein n=1 Tax=Characodon lateralis TaxID=208331 RepID=A0ABU7E0G9_9TELE|nr:hypothetical protein [Characodon lateralis]